MDYEAKLARIADNLRGQYQEKMFGPEEMVSRFKRITVIRARLRARQALDNKINFRINGIKKRLERLDLIRANQTASFMSIDVGSGQYSNKIEEIGVCIKQGFQIRKINFIVDKAKHKRIPIEDGENIYGNANDLREQVRDLYMTVDYGVFHAGWNDLKKLGHGLQGKKYHFDTAALAGLWYRESPKLKTLCERYGISTVGLHHSAIDAERTMLFAMLDDKSEPFVA